MTVTATAKRRRRQARLVNGRKVRFMLSKRIDDSKRKAS